MKRVLQHFRNFPDIPWFLMCTWIVKVLLCPISRESDLGGLTRGPAIETFPQVGFRCLIGRAHLEQHGPVRYQLLSSSFWGLVSQVQSTQLSSHPAHASYPLQEVIMRKKPGQWQADFWSHWCYCISLSTRTAPCRRKKWCTHDLFLVNLFGVLRTKFSLFSVPIIYSLPADLESCQDFRVTSW